MGILIPFKIMFQNHFNVSMFQCILIKKTHSHLKNVLFKLKITNSIAIILLHIYNHISTKKSSNQIGTEISINKIRKLDFSWGLINGCFKHKIDLFYFKKINFYSFEKMVYHFKMFLNHKGIR